MAVRLPNFLVAGVPKAGTTTLHQHLREHPDIFLPDKKELHYFSSRYLEQAVAGPGDRAVVERICRTLEQYQSYFGGADRQRAVGEVSPSYFFFADCIPEIKCALGDGVRIIIVLRQPVERAYSNWLHLVNAGREKLDFRSALAAEGERQQAGWGDFWRYRQHSLYADRLQSYLEAFPRPQVKVLLFEQIASDTLGAVQEVCRFLGVDEEFIPPNLGVVYGRGGAPRNALLEWFIRNASAAAAKVKPAVPRGWYGNLRRTKDRLAAQNRGKGGAPGLDDETYRELMAFFEDDIRRTEELLGRSLEIWRKSKRVGE